jgi:hypothetical protein
VSSVGAAIRRLRDKFKRLDRRNPCPALRLHTNRFWPAPTYKTGPRRLSRTTVETTRIPA